MKKSNKRKKYLIGGKQYTVPEISRLPWCPVNKWTIYSRLRNGMSIVEAITTKPGQTQKKYKYKGKLRSLSYLAELPECQVSRRTLSSRLSRLGWPVEFAVTTPRLVNGEWQSKEFQNKKMWAQPVSELIEMLDAKSQGA